MGSTPSGDSLIPVPQSQVGFRRAGEQWTFLTERELSRDAIANATRGSDVEVRVIADRGEAERLRNKLLVNHLIDNVTN